MPKLSLFIEPKIGSPMFGVVTEHPGLYEGQNIRTSCVKSINGSEVTTESGTVYETSI